MNGDIISDTVHEKCGLASGGQDIEEIKQNLITNTLKLIDDKVLRNKYALEGRTMIETTFEWKELVKSMDHIYTEIMDDNNAKK